MCLLTIGANFECFRWLQIYFVAIWGTIGVNGLKTVSIKEIIRMHYLQGLVGMLSALIAFAMMLLQVV